MLRCVTTWLKHCCFFLGNLRLPSEIFTIFGNFWKCSERLCGFGQLLVNLRKSLKSDRKSSENRRHKYVHIICSLVRYQVKHSKRNSISTRTIVLSSIYFVRPKYSCMYSRCELLSCSQTWYKAFVVASAHVINCVRYMLLLPGSLILPYLAIAMTLVICWGNIELFGKWTFLWNEFFSIWTTNGRSLNNFVFSQFCSLTFDFV